jgi:hypothetical protein
MSLTDNMDLNIQTPLTTSGPTWAAQINNNFSIIDGHNHTPGKGASLSQASITISGNYAFNTFRIVDAGSIQFTDLTVAPSGSGDINGIFSVNGDMYWVNAAGVAVKITSGSGINISSVGTIGGDYGQSGVTASALYSDTTKTFSWTQASGIAAKMAAGSLIIYHESTGVQGVTLASKAATAQYTLSFPTVAPTTTNMLRAYDAAGDSIFKTITTDGTLAVTPSASTFAFSLPQSIAAAATPTFAGLTLTAFSGVLKATAGVLSASAIVNADISASAGIVDTKLATISTAGKVSNSATTATSANTASAIVARDGNGDVTVRNVNATAIGTSTVSASSTITATGGVGTDGSLFLKYKRITGTTGNINTNTSIAHGLTKANIISVSGRVGDYMVPGHVNSSNYFSIYIDNTNVNVFNAAVSAGETITLLITYV